MDHRRPARILGGVVIGIGLIASGCSNGSDDSPSPPGQTGQPEPPAALPAPCELVTAKEAEAVLGGPSRSPTAEAERCNWTAADGRGFVTVAVRRDEQARAALEASRATDRGERVTGIGDEGYVALPAAELGIVAFVRGQMTVSILVRSPARDREAILGLARTAAGRI